MEIKISDRKVEKIISDYNNIIKKIGTEINFKEYLDIGLGDPHPLTGNLDRLFGIKINKNYRLIVEPISDFLDNESLKKCDKVDLKGVADYHDGKCEWIIP